MNTRSEAKENLIEFMRSDEKVVFITGTHQYEKHPLALSVIKEHAKSSKVLFRTNSSQMLSSHFENKNLKLGTFYKIGENKLCFDTINRRTWGNLSWEFDYSVLYPLDSVCKAKNKEEILLDLINRTKKKVFLASWTDSYDYSWLHEYIDRHVIYDAEAEDTEYHERVLNIIQGRF